jgi:hypothetical protein
MLSPESVDLTYHEARVLILLAEFPKGISSLTKLAKLDFLLRYPTVLIDFLHKDGKKWPDDAAPTDDELHAVESPMIRYKYGPWDSRYYPVLGALIAKDLVEPERSSRGTTFKVTERGRAYSTALAASETWSVIASRAKLLKRHFDQSGAALKSRIYLELASLMDRAHRSPIPLPED